VPATLTDLPAGHVFAPVPFTIEPEASRAYREAVGDALSVYGGAGSAVPPLAVAALGLGALLEQVTLPAGSLHASESVECLGVVPEGAVVECRARLAQRSVRAGWVVSVLDSEMLIGGEPAVKTRATVLSPAMPSKRDLGVQP
jgi:hypothetical protein